MESRKGRKMKPKIKNFSRLKLQLLTIILSTAVVLSGCSSSPGISFEGEITAKLAEEIDNYNTKLKLDHNIVNFKIKANLFRLEYTNKEGQLGPLGTTIMDLKSGIQRKINADEGTYSELDMRKSQIFLEDDAKAQNLPIITRTGKTETIAGYTCEYYQLEKMNLCVAKGLSYIPSGNDFRGGVLTYYNLQGDQRRMEADPEFKKLVESGGFPLKITFDENGQVKTYMEVTRIERKSLNDSLFQVPADYKRVEMPGIPLQQYSETK
jgi:hypothetical protein